MKKPEAVNFFDRPSSAVARGIVGKLLDTGKGKVVVISTARGFSRSENTTPPYRPMLEMQPGYVFVPVVQHHPIILIVCKNGSCIQITGVQDLVTVEEVRGAGKVAQYLGFTISNEIGFVKLKGDTTVYYTGYGTLEKGR